MAKKTSIIRYEAILPIGILTVLLAIYVQFFMDFHIRKGLEWSLSYGVGAEVNIRSLETHFADGSIRIEDIDITDADRPNTNLVSLEQILFSLNMDALLRGKVVINTAEVSGIATQTKRKKAGKVYPKPSKPSFVSTEFQKFKNNAMGGLKDKNAGTLFGDSLALLEGKDLQLTHLEKQLKSPLLITEFSENITKTEKNWTDISTNFTAPVSGLEKKLGSLQNISFKSVDDAQKWVENANSIYSDVQLQLKKVEDAQAQFNQDMNMFNTTIGKIDTTIAQDINSVKNYVQMPKFPDNQLSAYFFDTYLSQYLEQYETAMTWADTYLPPNLMHKKEDAYKITPIPRQSGILYTYGKQNTYPIFWLKQAKITSKASAVNPKIGALSGEITHLSTDQGITGHPFNLLLSGDFPGININGLRIQIVIDRRNQRVSDLFDLQIGAYPIQELILLDGTDLSLKVKQSYGRLGITAKRNHQYLDIAFTQYFEKIRFEVKAQNPIVNEITQAAFAQMTQTKIEATVKGPMNQLAFAINSPLGPDLANYFGTEIDKRIQAEKDRIQKEISAKLEAEMAKVRDAITQFNETYTRLIKEQEAALIKIQNDIKALQTQADSQLNGWKKDAEARLEQEKKKAEAAIENGKKEAEAKVEKERKEAELKLEKARKEADAKVEAEKNKQLDKVKSQLLNW